MILFWRMTLPEICGATTFTTTSNITIALRYPATEGNVGQVRSVSNPFSSTLQTVRGCNSFRKTARAVAICEWEQWLYPVFNITQVVKYLTYGCPLLRVLDGSIGESPLCKFYCLCPWEFGFSFTSGLGDRVLGTDRKMRVQSKQTAKPLVMEGTNFSLVCM